MQCAFLEFHNFRYFGPAAGCFVPSDHFVNSNVPILANTGGGRYPESSSDHECSYTQISFVRSWDFPAPFVFNGRCCLRPKNSLSRQSKNLSLIEMHSNRFPIRGLFLMEARAMVINRTQKRMCYRRFTHFSLPNLFHARVKTVLRWKVYGLEGPQLICHGVPSVSL